MNAGFGYDVSMNIFTLFSVAPSNVFDDVRTWLDQTLSTSIFFMIGGVALVVLILAVLLDGIFDSDGPISLVSIGAFGTMFGFSAAVAVGLGVEPAWASLCGAGVGLIGGLAAWKMADYFKKSSTTASYSSQSLVGTVAVVNLGIERGTGEVSFNKNGSTIFMTAHSEETIPKGRRVKIVDIVNDNSVMVEIYIPPTETVEGV